MGIVCPGGQEVGDRKSGDQMGSGPNASQPPTNRPNFQAFLRPCVTAGLHSHASTRLVDSSFFKRCETGRQFNRENLPVLALEKPDIAA